MQPIEWFQQFLPPETFKDRDLVKAILENLKRCFLQYDGEDMCAGGWVPLSHALGRLHASAMGIGFVGHAETMQDMVAKGLYPLMEHEAAPPGLLIINPDPVKWSQEPIVLAPGVDPTSLPKHFLWPDPEVAGKWLECRFNVTEEEAVEWQRQRDALYKAAEEWCAAHRAAGLMDTFAVMKMPPPSFAKVREAAAILKKACEESGTHWDKYPELIVKE